MGNYKKLFTIILFLILSSCNFMPNADESKMKKVFKKPTLNKISGSWEIDKFSYSFINESLNLKDNRIILTLNSDNTFEVTNYPKFDAFGIVKDSISKSYKGQWKFKKAYNKKSYNLILEDFSQKIVWAKEFVLYDKKNSGLILWKFVGDPDSGNRMMFKKIN